MITINEIIDSVFTFKIAYSDSYRRFEEQQTVGRRQATAGGYATQDSDLEAEAYARLPPRGRGEAR